MKENNKFPNIKATKLEEEINKDSQNNNFQKKKEKSCNYKGINYCLLYLILFFSIISFFVLNYMNTKDAFKENKYITLSSEKLCNTTIKTLELCIKEKTLAKCQIENKALELCYDEAYNMNQICFVFISELDLCLRKNKNNSNQCDNYFKDVVKCGTIYRHLQINKEYLKDIIN